MIHSDRSHADRVQSVVRSGWRNSDNGVDAQIAQSWGRSLDSYKIDANSDSPPLVLNQQEIKQYRQPLEPLLMLARSGMESLFRQIHGAGYVVMLSDANGIAVDIMNDPVLDSELRETGLYLGSCWGEDVEGTCALGLCTADPRPVTVHHGEHYRSRNGSLTCSAAPIRSIDGSLLAVLDASAMYSPDDKRSQHLILQMVSATARMIENAEFLRHFENRWVLRTSMQSGFLEVSTEGLVAMEENGTIIASNETFRRMLGLGSASLDGHRIEEFLGQRLAQLAGGRDTQISEVLPLRISGGDQALFATLRRPRASVRHLLEANVVGRRPPAAIAAAGSGLAALAGGDDRMTDNVSRAMRVLDKGIPVLVLGETGTGKEAFAKAMHEASRRASAAFVALNCAAIPDTLIESELFGYRDGAFTGARAKGARGKITQADGGTLFLDEIGDMPLSLQTRLLRVLAEREVVPLGADKPIPIDIQVVCATHRDLSKLVRAGEFRQDLYYRLNGVTLLLPALRDRSDKPALIRSVLRLEADELRLRDYSIDAEAMEALLRYHWPGNIRQLRNTLRSALALSDDRPIGLEHLPGEVLDGEPQATAAPLASAPTSSGKAGATPLSDPLQELQRSEAQWLVKLLNQHRWGLTSAAAASGISRSTIYRMMKRHGIVQPRYQGPEQT
ncbi:sigma-54-dependent Fis family transcriptional regulator [Hydrocarboniphaga effusa]|uniref:sigma-54-dependent Fis family transcriptional regulator n=1 Tax=Hydrocarboniphaga effusa TaxID=243629 RepID=UPI003BA9B16E